MKKLMIGLVGALAMVASAEVASENTVGYQGNCIAVGNRSMRSASTFLKVSENPMDIKISDIKQTAGYPGEITLCLYNDNVTRLAQYIYFTAEMGLGANDGEDIAEGWYILDDDSIPDFTVGVQNADLPYGQGCVIESISDEAEYTSAGEVDSIKREFTVQVGARKMMGNVLPRSIMLSELKQTTGYPGELTLCTYNDNVTRLAQYIYFSEEMGIGANDGEDIAEGWYILDDDSIPDFEAGVQDFEIPSGQGFVVESISDEAILQFPEAM